MQLRDVMTRRLEKISPEASLQEAAQLMKRWDIGALPVCENDRLIGLITDRDITVRAIADGQDPKRANVSDAMSQGLIFCHEDDTVESAAKLMEERQIRRLPVFDRSNRMVGIVSLGDLAVRNRDDHLSGEILERISEPSQSHA